MNHEVFISYANADRSVADPLVERIEETGVRCWIAPRDEVPGLRYGDVIDEAVEQATVVIVLFSRSALESEWVNREVELAAALHKTIVPVRVDDVALRGQMRLLLNNLHWVDLQEVREQGFQQVVTAALRFLPETPEGLSDRQLSATDIENQEFALGICQTQENSWDAVQDRFPVGSKIKGRVRNFTAYGAFVELEEGFDGMIHVCDMSWTRKIDHPSECLQEGQEVETVVLDVNPKEQCISLGLKQTQQDPWDEIAKKFSVGSAVKGKVSKIYSWGAFIELEDGVDALVHISQISDQRIEKVEDALAVGQEVEARVVKVDRGERRIGLSISAMTMTEDEIKALKAEAAG